METNSFPREWHESAWEICILMRENLMPLMEGGGKKNPAFLSIYCHKYVPSANLSTPPQLHPAAIHHAVEGTLAVCHLHAKGKPLPCKYRQVL